MGCYLDTRIRRAFCNRTSSWKQTKGSKVNQKFTVKTWQWLQNFYQATHDSLRTQYLQKDFRNEFLVYEPVWLRPGLLPPAVEARVETVEGWGQRASHVEPPVAGCHTLREHRAIGTQERRLATIDVAVVPCWNRI